MWIKLGISIRSYLVQRWCTALICRSISRKNSWVKHLSGINSSYKLHWILDWSICIHLPIWHSRSWPRTRMWFSWHWSNTVWLNWSASWSASWSYLFSSSIWLRRSSTVRVWIRSANLLKLWHWCRFYTLFTTKITNHSTTHEFENTLTWRSRACTILLTPELCSTFSNLLFPTCIHLNVIFLCVNFRKFHSFWLQIMLASHLFKLISNGLYSSHKSFCTIFLRLITDVSNTLITMSIVCSNPIFFVFFFSIMLIL